MIRLPSVRFHMTLIILSFCCITQVYAKNGKSPDQFISQIKSSAFPSEKSKYAFALASKYPEEARVFFLTLIDDQDYWNREAAVQGLWILKDQEIIDILIQKLSDHMIRSKIQNLFAAEPELTFPRLINSYNQNQVTEERKIILDAICELKVSDVEHFMQDIASRGDSEERLFAFQCLERHFPESSFRFIESFEDDDALRHFVLGFYLEHELSKKLGLFEKLLNQTPSHETAMLAFQAIDRWGDNLLKEQTMLTHLNHSDESIRLMAILFLRSPQSIVIRDALTKCYSNSSDILVKLHSANALCNYPSSDIVPVLISAINLRYSSPEKTFADVFAGGLSAGIVTMLSDYMTIRDRKDFEKMKWKIISALNDLTKQNFQDSYENWLEWGILSGYNIDGLNIFSYLYSPDAELRKKSISHATKLLGFESVEKYKDAKSLPNGENAALIEITRDLLDRGLLKNGESQERR